MHVVLHPVLLDKFNRLKKSPGQVNVACASQRILNFERLLPPKHPVSATTASGMDPVPARSKP